MTGVDEGPVVVFCAELKRRWRASGRDLASVAREVRISRAQLYAILNGEIKKPPDFEGLVRPLVKACGGSDAELAEWRRRHEVLVGVHAELRKRPVSQVTATRAVIPAQLPVDVERFAGRAGELAALDGAEARVVVVTGTAGVGKTALAVHWAHRVAEEYPDGQLYVNLRGFDRSQEVMDPGEAIRGFLEALGAERQRIPHGRDAQAALYRSMAAGRRLLVVLDNARDADQVRPLLAASPTVRTVVTSRDRLTALVAEIGAQPLELDLPNQAEAVELLKQRIGMPQDAREAEAVVAACGRLPLALALVAARARQTGFPLANLAAELRRPDAAALDEVRAVFTWSYRLLSPAAARLFRLLGLVAAADIATAAVTALAAVTPADLNRMLRELTEANLVIEHASGRYQLHDLLRAYARELAHHSETEGERRAALTRLLDHYTHTAYQADMVLNPTRSPIPMQLKGDGSDQRLEATEALEWMGKERAALLSALYQAKDEGLDRHAWQLGWALDTFLFEDNRWEDESAAWAVALRAATALMDRSAAAHAHQFLAVVAGRLQSFAEAEEHIRQAAELSQAAGDRIGEAETEFRLSYICWLQSDHDRALHHAEKSLALWAQLHHPGWEGRASNAVGWYHGQLGDYHTALPYFERALTLQQQAGDLANQIIAHDGLGQAHEYLGNHETAIEHYRQGLELSQAIANPLKQAQLAVRLGDVYQSVGEHATARELWEQAYQDLIGAGYPQAADVRRKIDTAGE
jgi:tetratricopeptide (TPR) repeat protein